MFLIAVMRCSHVIIDTIASNELVVVGSLPRHHDMPMSEMQVITVCWSAILSSVRRTALMLKLCWLNLF